MKYEEMKIIDYINEWTNTLRTDSFYQWRSMHIAIDYK